MTEKQKKFDIVANSNTSTNYQIYIWDNIEEYDHYTELLVKLSKITSNDSVSLTVTTPGGRCDIGFMLIDKFQSLSCPVNVIVPYPTYSMGAIMALCGNSLKIQPGGFLMFHDYSTGARGKGNEIYKSTEAYQEAFGCKFNQICQPFLTKKECRDVLNGQDLYIKWNDDQLTERLARHFKEK